jgi:hypothetical protein
MGTEAYAEHNLVNQLLQFDAMMGGGGSNG